MDTLERMRLLFDHDFKNERHDLMVEMFAVLAFGEHHKAVTGNVRTEEEVYEMWVSLPPESRRAWKAATARVVISYDKLKAGCW